MDKELLLRLLAADAEKKAPTYERYRRKAKLTESLIELNNRRPIQMPSPLPDEPASMLDVLRQCFSNRVSLISLVLSHHFPDQFFLYRAPLLDREISDGLAFFADLEECFQFDFACVGNDVDRYQVFNTKLQEFARKAWPAMRHRQAAILAFLYEGLGMLFLEKSSYNRYWIMVTKPEHWDSLDRESEPEWSGRKEMKDGDLVFMYRTSPRKAITNLYRVHGAPWFDPWGAWDGWWVKLQSVGAIPEITFAAMRADPVLKDWGLVRRQFQWTVTERVPHRVYNQLLQKMPPEFCEQYDLRPVELGRIGSSGKYGTEAEFEDEVVKPLIRRWGLQFDYQYPCLFYVGSQATRGRVDCFVRDARGPITLFENKLRIANMAERESAVAQAKSYALMLGLPSFIVAAPEGLWVYSLTRNRHIEECYVPGDQLGAQEEHVRNVVMRLRM